MMYRQSILWFRPGFKTCPYNPGHYGKGSNTHFSDASENEAIDQCLDSHQGHLLFGGWCESVGKELIIAKAISSISKDVWFLGSFG